MRELFYRAKDNDNMEGEEEDDEDDQFLDALDSHRAAAHIMAA